MAAAHVTFTQGLLNLGLFYGGLILFVLLLHSCKLVVRAVRAIRARRRAWSLALLVSADAASGTLCPTLQLAGSCRLARPALRVELVDRRGKVRHRMSRGIDVAELEADLELPPLSAGALGVDVSELQMWTWHVVLLDGRRRRGRLRGPLRAPASTNQEAELNLDEIGAEGTSSLYIAGRPRRSDLARRWWDTPFGRWRLSAEVEAMRRFPGFGLHRSGAALCWVGRLESAVTGGGYLVRLTYPDHFPDQAPAVKIEEPELVPSTPHLLSQARPCLYNWVEGPAHGYDPARTTAATLVAWTALWVHAYETWQATGAWPGRGD